MISPSLALLRSMAMRYDHSFGLLADDDPKRAGILTIMRQLWEEVAGVGFFKGPGTLSHLQQQIDEAWHAHTMMTQDRDALLGIRNGVSEALSTVPVDPRYPTLVEHAAHVVGVLRAAQEDRENLRNQFIKLQIEIGDLIPPEDGDRANDPIINRVKRLVQRYEDSMTPLNAPHHSPEKCPTYYDGCNCSVECLIHNINRAEHAEKLLGQARNWVQDPELRAAIRKVVPPTPRPKEDE